MPFAAPSDFVRPPDPEALQVFVSNPAFRSAEGHELILGSPFHRPVRPHDLGLVKFSGALDHEHRFGLSALMAHRMLLNIHEAEFVFMPSRADDYCATDRAAFYAQGSAGQGAQILSGLEQHVFGAIRSQVQAEVSDQPAQLQVLLAERMRELAPERDLLLQALARCHDRERAARLLVIQLSGPLLSKELAIARRICLDWGDMTPLTPAVPTPQQLCPALRSLARSAGLLDHAHAYWQFYLGSWIGVANLMHGLARDPRQFAEFLGALLCDRVRQSSKAAAYRQSLQQALPGLDTSCFSVCMGPEATDTQAALRRVTELAGRLGAGAMAAVMRGFASMAGVYAAAEADLVAQLEWADQAPANRQKASDLHRQITERRLAVDMETYDEPVTERSTTHVHDTDRLLVIESGAMDFWSNFGPSQRFVPGDMIFVPRHRLHGSVVATERCVYHQPIINDTLLRQLRSATGN